MKDKNNALPILCDTCGGPLRYSSDGLEAACPYCGNRYNFRGGRSEALSLALSRANSYRLNCDFSEAEREQFANYLGRAYRNLRGEEVGET